MDLVFPASSGSNSMGFNPRIGCETSSISPRNKQFAKFSFPRPIFSVVAKIAILLNGDGSLDAITIFRLDVQLMSCFRSVFDSVWLKWPFHGPSVSLLAEVSHDEAK